MTVGELIAALRRHPEEMYVTVVSGDDFTTPAFLLEKAHPDGVGFSVLAYGDEVR